MAMGYYELRSKKPKNHPLIKKLEKFFSGPITCWGRKNAFCDSRIWFCLPCIKLRFILRYGRLPFSFGINVKNGTFYFVSQKRFTCSHAFFMSFEAQRRYKEKQALWLQMLKKSSNLGE